MPDQSSPSPDRVPARPRILKLPRKRGLALGGALAVLSLIAVACGGFGGAATTETQGAGTIAQDRHA